MTADVGERILGSKERVLDVLARWERLTIETPEKKEEIAGYKFMFKGMRLQASIRSVATNGTCAPAD